jgi:hypothetical protein
MGCEHQHPAGCQLLLEQSQEPVPLVHMDVGEERSGQIRSIQRTPSRSSLEPCWAAPGWSRRMATTLETLATYVRLRLRSRLESYDEATAQP